MVRDTSSETYRTIVLNGLLSKRRMEIYMHLYESGPLTASEVFRNLHLKTNQSGRFTEMERLGVIKEVGIKKDAVTGMSVTLWDVTSGLPEKITKPTKADKKRLIKDKLNKIAPWIPDMYSGVLQDIYREIDKI